MGICIAYMGKLSDPTVVPELVADLQRKAEAACWPCKTMDELLAEGLVTCPGLRGITLYPHPECEPVHFHFDPDGTFVNHFYHALLHDEDKAKMMAKALAESMALVGGARSRRARKPRASNLAFFKEGMSYNWTKTQFAGAKVHVAVCELLRHVKDRYAPDLKVTDDSKYFDEGDESKLEAQLAYVDHIVGVTAQAFETVASSSQGPMTLDGLLEGVNRELADAKNRLH